MGRKPEDQMGKVENKMKKAEDQMGKPEDVMKKAENQTRKNLQNKNEILAKVFHCNSWKIGVQALER